MARELDQDELVEHWTLIGDDLDRVAGKRGAAKLGFALLLKFFAARGRFPRGCSELPPAAVEFVAKQLQVSAADLGFYEWSGRSIERHRAEIREALGFCECSVVDADKLTDWLVANVTQAERRADQVRADLLQRCREEGIEPPSPGRIERIVRSALHQGEQLLFTRIAARLSTEVCARLDALVTAVPDDPGETVDERDVLAWVKTDPGRLSLNTMLDEITKLEAIRALELPEGLLGDVAGKVVASWRARAAVQDPSHLRALASEARWSVLAALLVLRQQEITDNLVELLMSTVHTIGARADRRVTEEMVSSFKRVRNKQHMLHRVAEAALDRPDETVRSVVFQVAGGEQTLRDVVAEFKASSPQFRKNVQVKLRGSYSNHYRRGLLKLVQTLQFRSNNTMHAPGDGLVPAWRAVRAYPVVGTQLPWNPVGILAGRCTVAVVSRLAASRMTRSLRDSALS